MDEPTTAGVLNRINWDRLGPGPGEGLVDSNASPVLLWQPAEMSESVLGVNLIGSQADSIVAVSTAYQRWINRTISWIRRKGTKVWGLEQGEVGQT